MERGLDLFCYSIFKWFQLLRLAAEGTCCVASITSTTLKVQRDGAFFCRCSQNALVFQLAFTARERGITFILPVSCCSFTLLLPFFSFKQQQYRYFCNKMERHKVILSLKRNVRYINRNYVQRWLSLCHKAHTSCKTVTKHYTEIHIAGLIMSLLQNICQYSYNA